VLKGKFKVFSGHVQKLSLSNFIPFFYLEPRLDKAKFYTMLKGDKVDEKVTKSTFPLYESSCFLTSHISQNMYFLSIPSNSEEKRHFRLRQRDDKYRDVTPTF